MRRDLTEMFIIHNEEDGVTWMKSVIKCDDAKYAICLERRQLQVHQAKSFHIDFRIF